MFIIIGDWQQETSPINILLKIIVILKVRSNMKQTIEAVKSDNKELTQQLYSSYKRIVDLNKQVEYLTSKIETMETQLELFSKDKLK